MHVASCAVINEQREWKAAPQDTYAEIIQIEINRLCKQKPFPVLNSKIEKKSVLSLL